MQTVLSLIHICFNIVLDINSGCIHLVDEVTYEVLPYLEEGLGTEAIAEKLENKYNREDIETSVRECNKLKEDGMLFTKDVYENVIEEFSNNRQTVVKALCLHIAHDCNLACRYCFAEEGEYHGRRALMSVSYTHLSPIITAARPITMEPRPMLTSANP